MKPVDTFPGKWYVVTSASGCTVSFEKNGGTVTLDMQAPQDVFCAVSGKATVSDDAAFVTPTFNLAPSFFKAARGWGQDPIWFKSLHAVLTRLLDGTQFEMVLTEQGSKLIVHTDRVADDLLEQVRTTAESYLPAGVELVQYNHNMEISWRDINKYAACRNIADMKAVNPDYKNDLTSDGEWVYPLTKLTTWERYLFSGNRKFKKIGISEFPSLTGSESMISNTSVEEIDCDFPALKWSNYLFSSDTLRKVRTAIGRNVSDANHRFYNCLALEEIYCDMSWEKEFHQTFENCKNLRVLDSYFSNANNMTFAFSRCRLPKDITLRVLNTIPAYTSGSHSLAIGIHIDHQQDEEVLAAIANAEAKGWTLTVQWNGTPTAATASTFGLRGQLIYAKVSEHERPDGTTERVLDWGHYVTNEEGYETFRSLESAYEYFGLPMPEEESQPTE